VTATPRSAAALLAALADAGARPRVDGRDLVCDATPPELLDRRLAVLHTGVRAILTRQPWYGCDADTGFAWELNPAAPIPARVGLLCVGGDSGWDRIKMADREAAPDLFVEDGKRTHRSGGQGGARAGRRVYFIPLRATST
jgi:hypothetical protein